MCWLNITSVISKCARAFAHYQMCKPDENYVMVEKAALSFAMQVEY